MGNYYSRSVFPATRDITSCLYDNFIPRSGGRKWKLSFLRLKMDTRVKALVGIGSGTRKNIVSSPRMMLILRSGDEGGDRRLGERDKTRQGREKRLNNNEKRRRKE